MKKKQNKNKIDNSMIGFALGMAGIILTIAYLILTR